MDRDLEDALVRVGWDALYERYIDTLRPANSQSERAARSPFPFSDDRTASFSVNIRSGLWKCWHSAPITGLKGGNYVQFIALMNSTIGQDGRPIVDTAAAERTLRVELGLSRPVDPVWLARCQMNFAHADSPFHNSWIGHKPWSQQTLSRLGIGYDPDRGRIVIPVQSTDGSIANCRMYRPGSHPKMLWSQVGLSDNYLFPYSSRQEPWVVLVEGEADVITLRCLGYNGCCGTMGCGNPIPPGRWWVGKRIYVWMDVDEPGIEATETACSILRDGAEEIRVVQTPEWEDRPNNADASDWIMYMFRQGMAPEQIQREITKLLGEARLVETATSAYDMDPISVDFTNALTAVNLGRKIEFSARTLGKSQQIYGLTVRAGITCPAQGHTFCRTCVMHTQWHGNATTVMDPRSQLTLKLVQTSEEMRNVAIKEHMHIPLRCPEPRIEILQNVDVEVVMLGSTLIENEATSITSDRSRHEALVIMPTGERIEENTDYKMRGFVYNAPKSQHQIFLLDKFTRKNGRHDSFQITDDVINKLDVFRPRGDIITSLAEIANDMERSYTGIRGRPDLHIMFRSVWHSVLAFEFGGSIYKRGWIEALIVGDTRCGKSATFRRMAEMYGTGMFVDCKMQSAAGMIGAVESSVVTGERFVVAGLYPQQDGAGPICMDEFSTSRWEQRSIMDHMSSMRAEGLARITKAAQATFLARVRAIWMCNPGQGRLMRDIGGYGVECINRLISQPEDIARFDLAMCVSQEDVPLSTVNAIVPPTTPRWTQEDHRMLLSWTWSRKPDQICWTGGAEHSVLALAEEMVLKYDADIPLVEPSDQRMRVAKLSVSIAAQCFSTDDTGSFIVVRPEHVQAAAFLYGIWYDKPSFGYNLYSQKIRIDRHILNEREVEILLDRILIANPVILANKLMRLTQFNERVLGTLLPLPFLELKGALQTLSINRCIRMCFHNMEAYELTPAFVRYLQRYIEGKMT